MSFKVSHLSGLAASLALSAWAGHAMAESKPSSPMAFPQMVEFPAGKPPEEGIPHYPTVTFQDGKGYVWAAEDLQRYGRGAKYLAAGTYGQTPAYRVAVVVRPPHDISKANCEVHEDFTQVYFVVSGTGTQYLGGAPADPKSLVKHNYGHTTAYGELNGAEAYRIKPGDMIVIPPNTWHMTLPDEGQTIVYQMVDITTRRRMGP